VEMTLASARDTIRILSWLKGHAPHVEPVVVANKLQPGIQEISVADFEVSIERRIGFFVPYDIKAATNAAKLGQTFADANRSTKAGIVIRDIAKKVMSMGNQEEADEGHKGQGSLLSKLQFKSFLSKKTKSRVRAKG